MKLSELQILSKNTELIRDSDFKYFAQCVMQLEGKIFTFFDDEKFLSKIYSNKSISCVICSIEDVDKIPKNLGILASPEPRLTFFKLYNLVMERNFHPLSKSIISNNVHVGNNCTIAKTGVYIGNHVSIGDNVVIEQNTYIGDNVQIGSSCVIGSEGFEAKRSKTGMLFSVRHFGRTVIENDTVLKSSVSIHRAVFNWDETKVGRNCIVDSMVHIAHGVKIHNAVLIGANATLCGNCEIMDYAYIGPNACISNRLIVGEHSKVSIASVVTKDVDNDMTVTGNFAIEHKKWISFIKKISK